jgi:acetoin utilization deacetylase AcuC-like enzyme
MKVFYSNNHRLHDPPFEIFDGGQRVPYLENPNRIDNILSALAKTGWAEITGPEDFGLGPVLAIHDAGYINFLSSAWDEWVASSYPSGTIPKDAILLPATFALRRHPHVPGSVLGRAGYYIMDLSACIVKGTYKAALSSVNCALTGAKFIVDQPIDNPIASSQHISSFALCRPPGHHAGKDYAAGYCFINNAAVAANWLSARGKVTLLDIDYHACNGTQDIFYDRSDVLTISLHGDPDFEYPYYAGYADETGKGEGLNYHKNFPLQWGTNDPLYLATLDIALDFVLGFAPKYLVVSIGADIFKDDPLGKFKITKDGFYEIGKKIAGLEMRSLIVMEGGYNNQALGENIVSFLSAFI